MDLKAYYRLIFSEGKAKKYLSGKCFKNHHRYCPGSQCRKLYKLRERRYRCSRCQYAFREFSGRWINQGRLTRVQWLYLIKLFGLEVSVRKIAQQMSWSES
jgi:transposase